MEQAVRQQVQKPRLEIPDPKIAGNGSSPRSMHGFPQSPQSPGEVSPASGEMKGFEDWTSQSVPISPVTTSHDDTEVEKKSLHFYVGEFVLVRCNQSKWLLGQVRRSSKTGVIVWVGAAQTLVNVPYDLLVSHLVKLDNPSLPTSPSSSLTSQALEVGRHGQLLAPFQCVRPAHLSHRKLYQPLKFVPAEAITHRSTSADYETQGTSCFMNVNLQQTSIGNARVSVKEPAREMHLRCTVSSSLPAFIPESLQGIKSFGAAERYYKSAVIEQSLGVSTMVENKVPEVVPPSLLSGCYTLCRFKFTDEDLFPEGHGLEEAESFEENQALGKQCNWITIIENGLDIRKKQIKS